MALPLLFHISSHNCYFPDHFVIEEVGVRVSGGQAGILSFGERTFYYQTIIFSPWEMFGFDLRIRLTDMAACAALFLSAQGRRIQIDLANGHPSSLNR